MGYPQILTLKARTLTPLVFDAARISTSRALHQPLSAAFGPFRRFPMFLERCLCHHWLYMCWFHTYPSAWVWWGYEMRWKKESLNMSQDCLFLFDIFFSPHIYLIFLSVRNKFMTKSDCDIPFPFGLHTKFQKLCQLGQRPRGRNTQLCLEL